MTIGNLADDIQLSQATVTTILDRLEERGYLDREGSTSDKRKVYIKLAQKGEYHILNTPAPMKNNFVSQFTKLNEWEQTTILSALQRIAFMMEAEEIDVAPILKPGEAYP